MPENLSIFAALTMGFAGGLHCIAMCGGISGALGYASTRGHYMRLLAYHLGRIASYTGIGFIFGGFGWLIGQQSESAHGFLQLLSAVLLIVTAVHLSGFWRGLAKIEKLGARFWAYIQPFSRTLFPVNTTPKAAVLGLIWGWLPCGLVYSALAWSVTSGSFWKSALLMMCFGLGTLPWLLLPNIGGKSLSSPINNKAFRIFFALVLMSIGLLSLFFALENMANMEKSHIHQH